MNTPKQPAPSISQQELDAQIVHTEIVTHVAPSGQVLRWAVLTLKNGFAATGDPSCAASKENDDPARGSTIAIQNAEHNLWGHMGFALKDRIYREQMASVEALQSLSAGESPNPDNPAVPKALPIISALSTQWTCASCSNVFDKMPNLCLHGDAACTQLLHLGK